MHTPLKAIRLRRNVTTQQLSDAVKVTQPTISRVENGRKRPSPDLANRIAKYFNGAITRDQILFPEDYAEKRATRRSVKAA